MSDRPYTPELDKLRAAKAELAYVSLNNFFDWMRANGWLIATEDPAHPVPHNFDQLFARYAEVDMRLVDAEIASLVEWHTATAGHKPHTP